MKLFLAGENCVTFKQFFPLEIVKPEPDPRIEEAKAEMIPHDEEGAIIGVAFNTNKAERPFKGREREGEVGSVEDKEGGRRNSSLPEDSASLGISFPSWPLEIFFSS